MPRSGRRAGSGSLSFQRSLSRAKAAAAAPAQPRTAASHAVLPRGGSCLVLRCRCTVLTAEGPERSASGAVPVGAPFPPRCAPVGKEQSANGEA
jgi:hypothetical protein